MVIGVYFIALFVLDFNFIDCFILNWAIKQARKLILQIRKDINLNGLMQKDWFKYWNGRNETIHKHLYGSQENPVLKNIHWLEPIPGLQQKVCQDYNCN